MHRTRSLYGCGNDVPGLVRFGPGSTRNGRRMTKRYRRELKLELRQADDDERTAPAVLSTEFAVDRGGFLEVLSHREGAVDLSRAPLPLLEVHDARRVNVGVVEDLRVVGRKLRGVVRFGTSRRAQELWEDVKAGIVRSLSVGYEWLAEGVRKGDTITVTAWMPVEASLVPVPADPNAGLFRMKRGRQLASLLNRLIDEQETEDRPRSEIIEAMGDAAGIDAGTVNQILNADIDCPPLDRLQGFADALDVSAESLINAAEDDGCSYDDEERAAACHCEVRAMDTITVSNKSRSERRAERHQKQAEDERVERIESLIRDFVGRCAKDDDRTHVRNLGAKALADGWPADAFATAAGERVLASQRNVYPVPVTPDYEYGQGTDARSIVAAARGEGIGQDRETRDRVMRAFGETRRVAEARAHVAGQWARAALLGHADAARWLSDGGYSRALAGGIASKGGVLVPEELSDAVIDLREQFGVFRQFARVMPMNSDILSVPRRTGRVSGTWVGENTTISADDGSWDNVELVAKKLAALTRMSSELSEDSTIDVASFLAMEFAMSFAEAEDDAGWNGDGTSTFGGHEGVLSKISGLAGEVAATSGNDTFAEISAVDLTTLAAALPAYALPGAAWYCSQACNQLVFQRLAQASGGATMVERGSIEIGMYGGYPIRVSQKLPTSTGDLSDSAMLVFGDLRLAAMMGDRRTFRLEVLTERYADLDQIGVKGTERVSIVVHDVGDATNAGPLVVLLGN